MASPDGQGNPMMSLVMLGMIGLVFYFFMIRPQIRKQKELKSFRSSLKKGDSVVTIGGIHGKIESVSDTTIMVNIADGLKIKVEKSAVIADFQAHQQTSNR